VCIDEAILVAVRERFSDHSAAGGHLASLDMSFEDATKLVLTAGVGNQENP
jgi:hypothetical protein